MNFMTSSRDVLISPMPAAQHKPVATALRSLVPKVFIGAHVLACENNDGTIMYILMVFLSALDKHIFHFLSWVSCCFINMKFPVVSWS
jgi:hypothetical protein